MFTLITIKDKVRIDPDDFSKDHLTAIEDVIHAKYSNKFLTNRGMCVSVYDLVKIGDPYVLPGEGSCQVEVTFRMMMFRPVIDEVIVGYVKECDRKAGIRVTLSFFDEIWIPPHLLPDNSRFDEAEKVWIWDYEGNEMHFDIRWAIRFKVSAIMYPLQMTDLSNAPKIGANKKNEDLHKDKAPMIIEGTIKAPGLGLVHWWDGPTEEE